MRHTVTFHAIMTFDVDARDSPQAIHKAEKLLPDTQWQLCDAVTVDEMGNSHEQDYFGDEL